MINFQCPACQQSLEVEDNGAGMTLGCPACAAEIVVPGQVVQDTPESVLRFVRYQAERKAALKMYYAAADVARDYMGPLAEATKAERELLALEYEQQGRAAEGHRRPAAEPSRAVEPAVTPPAVQAQPIVPTRVEPARKRLGGPRFANDQDRPSRVVSKIAPAQSDASSPAPASGAVGDLPPILKAGWRLLCGSAVIGLVVLLRLDSELRTLVERNQPLLSWPPPAYVSLQLQLQNPFSMRSALFDVIGGAAGALLTASLICGIIALAKDHVNRGLALLAAAALSFGVFYLGANLIARNRLQPAIDQTNQQLQQMQQSMDGVIQQMQRQIQQFRRPHR
ncbi:MAG: hypothetical protein PCFJNLEI_03317 [Verrucomicrobiae bacterium]|nr:hypothetical protein [Verrucomicrobiae bacterium]